MYKTHINIHETFIVIVNKPNDPRIISKVSLCPGT